MFVMPKITQSMHLSLLSKLVEKKLWEGEEAHAHGIVLSFDLMKDKKATRRPCGI